MQVRGTLANQSLHKKGVKLTIAVEPKNTAEIMKHLHNFVDKPLILDVRIDDQEQLKRLNEISPGQRSKIYALLKDIAAWSGDVTESVKQEMKNRFCYDNQYEAFSLSNCSRELAGDFVEFLVRFCFEQGVSFSEHPREAFGEDIEAYLRLCIEKKVCCICGGPMDGPGHHVQAIGMGRNRKTYDDSKHEKVALCRKHHTEAETIGWETFANKYHVTGVLV